MTAPLGVAAALVSSCTWAYATARYTLAAREVSPVRVSWMRMAMSAPIWLALAALVGVRGQLFDLRNLTILGASTLCSYALADSVFFAAARSIGVSSALAIGSTYPLWAALEGTLVEGEPFGPARALGTLFCTGGVAAIVKLGGPREAVVGSRTRGLVLAAVTSLLWAGNAVAIKTGSVGLALPVVNAYRYTFALGLLSVLLLCGRAPGPTRPARGWLPMIPAVFFDCVLGTACFVYGLTHTDLAVGATLTSLAPLVSLPFAVRLGAEKLTRAKALAVTATVTGVVLLSS